VFAAAVVDGSLDPQPDEVLEVAYFDLSALPTDVLVGQRRGIMDAVSGKSGSTHSRSAVYPLAHSGRTACEGRVRALS
jgi:hypothetical protein